MSLKTRIIRQEAPRRSDTAQIAAGVAGALGCVTIPIILVCVAGVLFLFGSVDQIVSAVPATSSGPSRDPAQLYSIVTGDGTGRLAEDQVPEDLVDAINDAGAICEAIGPVVIASQIQVESGFDREKTGQDGRRGLSQLTPDVFADYGEDDDGDGTASASDPEDSVLAQGRYMCFLAGEWQRLLADGLVTGNVLNLTLTAYRLGLDAVRKAGSQVAGDTYAYDVRVQMPRFLQQPGTEPSAASSSARSPSPSSSSPPTDGGLLPVSSAQFDEMFPGRNPFYSYTGLTDAVRKFPAFAKTGDATVRKREIAAFLANVGHESGGMVYVEEINQAAWGDYCDAAQPYGCPAGTTAYHGRGPIQLSWNFNYKAAGDALGIDLLNEPDLVKNDSSVAWQTALWFWTTQSGAGTMTPHQAITGDGGFAETIRSINGARECNGGNPAQVRSRVASFRRFTEMLDVEPGNNLSC